MEGKLHGRNRQATPEQAQGPFYPVSKPSDQDSDLTSVHGRNDRAQGQVIEISGQVLNMSGVPIPRAQVEIWQANTFGRYTHPQDGNPAPLDPAFQGYGTELSGADGRYHFKTVKPGAYPVGEGRTRPPHVHFIITGPSSRLVTQMYFDGEPLNEKDPILNSADSKEVLIVKLKPSGKASDPQTMTARWDIVLPEG